LNLHTSQPSHYNSNAIGLSESQHVNGRTANVSETRDERDEIALERNDTTNTTNSMAKPSVRETEVKDEFRSFNAPDSNEMSESNAHEHGYMLRPRVKRNYKE
jgi:hypothetical protein